MSEKTPTERFLMTVPKPVYDWLSIGAEKHGVTVQDRIRMLLEAGQAVYSEYEKLGVADQEKLKMILEASQIILSDFVNLYATSTEKERKQWSTKEFGAKLEKECYQLGKYIYDEFATERKRLTIIQMSDEDTSYDYYKEYNLPNDFVLPVIRKDFQPLENNELNKYVVAKAAKQVADVENELLSICDDGDMVFEALPFGGSISHKDGNWRGWFRISLNSAKTPSMVDAIRVTS